MRGMRSAKAITGVALAGIALMIAGVVRTPPVSAAGLWEAQNTGTKASLRGLSVVDNMVVWTSGSSGTYVRTNDGGRSWTAAQVKGAEELDFRGVKAFDANTAVLMSSGPAEQGRARLYRTSDGGAHWSLVYETKAPGAFLDCMAFWDHEHGLAVGDPVGGKFFVLVTDDGGKTWSQVDPGLVHSPKPGERASHPEVPQALKGEGAFAASNSCVAVEGSSKAWFVTGGAGVARVFRTGDRGRTWQVTETPVDAATASSGLFSVAFSDARHGVAVGGDYQKAMESRTTAALTGDGGRTWALAAAPAAGLFLSGVASTGEGTLLAVGPAGWAESRDGGHTWAKGGDTGFNVVAFGGGRVWAAGNEGRVSRFALIPSPQK